MCTHTHRHPFFVYYLNQACILKGWKVEEDLTIVKRHGDLTIVKRCKLQWCGHVSRSLCLAKTILQGTVKGGRRQNRQRKRREDNIREWTVLEFTKSQRAVRNREKWRTLVVKSSVVPQQPLRLRDRWWWWWWWKKLGLAEVRGSMFKRKT